MTYTNTMDTTAAIIPVAGLSSRMNRFKPLLELNGFPMIRLTVQSALDGGAQNVCVITGRNAPKIKEALAYQEIIPLVQGLEEPAKPQQGALCFVHNPEYAQSDMLQSIKLGIKALQVNTADSEGASHCTDYKDSLPAENCFVSPEDTPQSDNLHNGRYPVEACFVLPGDMPGVSPQTFAALRNYGKDCRPAVLVPTNNGKQGHPLLVSSTCFEALLSFEGEGGLRQALADFEWHEVEVDDPGIQLDADDPEAFALLEHHVRKIRGVSTAVIEELFALYQTPKNVTAHTKAVAEVALRMAHALNRCGQGLDSELCYSGGALHDLNRLERNHSRVAATNLQAFGYEALAAIVAAHDRELVLRPHMFTEANIVFTADKLVKETTLVQIEGRYKGALKRFPPDTEIGKLIQKDSKSAFTLLNTYVKLTGDTALLKGTGDIVRESYATT